MKVVNVHQRLLHASPERVGALIDALASPADVLWPGTTWPPMRFGVLEHRIEMNATGRARLFWPLVIRPLHDACVEDLLSRAQAAHGNTPLPVPWSPRVRFLRWLMAPRKRPGRQLQGEPHAG